jgi:hypothetical protein
MQRNDLHRVLNRLSDVLRKVLEVEGLVFQSDVDEMHKAMMDDHEKLIHEEIQSLKLYTPSTNSSYST